MTPAKEIVRHMLVRSVADLDPRITVHIRLEINAAERETMKAWRIGRKGVSSRPARDATTECYRRAGVPDPQQRQPNYGSVKDAQRRGLRVSHHSLYYWETGQRRPTLAQYLQWCEAIGYTPMTIKVLIEGQEQ